MHTAFMNSQSFSTRHQRLAWARQTAGFDSPTDAARAMGVPPPTYLGHENGSRGVSRDAAVKYAEKFKVSLEWLLTGKGVARGKSLTAVVGYIGAGAKVVAIDDHAPGAGLEFVEPPPGVEYPCVAARIRGNSMHPFRDGWVVFWSKDQEGVSDDCLGQLCVVCLADDSMYLKELHRGSSKGKFTLASWNAPAIENVAVKWAARVIDVRTA